MEPVKDAASEVEDEGMSTKKKVAAGAAIGVAVPAAVGVAKKLLATGDDSADEARQGSAGGARRASGSRSQTQRRTSRTARSSATSTSRGSERTKEQLYNQAKRLNIEGRSKMTKAQLARAVGRARS